MRFMVLVPANQETERGVMPKEADLASMGKFNEELVKAGVMLAGEGLHPSSKGKRVRFSGNKVSVIDGPFAETKELIAGFWLCPRSAPRLCPSACVFRETYIQASTPAGCELLPRIVSMMNE